MRILLLALAILPISACTVAESAPPGGVTEGPCRSEPLAQFVGQPATQELGARMMAASGAEILRWVPKGGMVTMDYNSARLTVALDGSNRVEMANCG